MIDVRNLLKAAALVPDADGGVNIPGVTLRAAIDRIEALEAALSESFDFLGGIDNAADIRGRLLAVLTPSAVQTSSHPAGSSRS